MKRVLVIGMLLAVSVGFVALLSLRPTAKGWNPNTTMTFLGFTNGTAGAPATNALFGFNQIPAGETSWETVELSHWDGSNWVSANASTAGSFSWFQPGGATNFHGGSTNYILRGTVPVGGAPGPVRVVIRLTRAPGKFWRTVGEFLGPLARILRQDPTTVLAGPSDRYFMTNEFNFGSANKAR